MWCLQTGFDDQVFARLTRLERKTFYDIARKAAERIK